MKLQAKVLIGAAGLLAIAAYAAQDSTRIEWKPKVGETTRYRMNMTADIDAGGQMMNMQFGMITTGTVQKVEDDKVTIESSASDFTIMVGGQDMSSMMGDMNYTAVTIFNRNGEIIEVRTDAPAEMTQARIENAYVFFYPNRDIKVGESWVRKIKGESARGTVDAEATFTFHGSERMGERNTHKVGMVFKETGGAAPMNVTGTLWLNVEDGELVKGEWKMTNVEFQPGMPPASANATLTRL